MGVLSLSCNECQNFFIDLLKQKKPHTSSSAPRVPDGRTAYHIVMQSWRLCMHFRPLHDRVVVRRIEAEEKTSGGIITPDTAKEKPQEGEVAAAGLGAGDDNGKPIEHAVNAGDRVRFGKWRSEERSVGKEIVSMGSQSSRRSTKKKK